MFASLEEKKRAFLGTGEHVERRDETRDVYEQKKVESRIRQKSLRSRLRIFRKMERIKLREEHEKEREIELC